MSDPATHIADLAVEVPLALKKELLSKLYYVSEDIASACFPLDRQDRIEFSLKATASVSPDDIGSRISKMAETLCESFRGFSPKVLVHRSTGPVRYAEDPHPELERRGEIRRFGQGRYGFGPLLTTLMNGLDQTIIKMAQGFNAPHHQFPSMIGADVLERCRYIQSFPHSLNLVSHLREDLSLIERFAKETRWTGTALELSPETLAPPKCLLSPSVCFHWYAWSQDSTVRTPAAITAIGKCFRYESGNLSGLEHLWDFTMREIVFMGSRDHVLAQRQKAIDETVRLLDKLNLAYQIEAATDPFFMTSFGAQSAFQLAFDLKFEISAPLPYRKSALAVGSFNHHQDFFGRTFSINGADARPVDTGCVGFGLERLALALIAQHGLELNRWPSTLRDLANG